ncbi:enkurin domain-containing protein 1 isoform X1 [Sarcophilus harrisii]|uniref:Enkurin domain containing 1 n=1 Tax=Sarcophilus harrisii TaxID=9305 RepID=G3VRK7_SARHA|nr:enkurin domain-containing protein 1 isoform X1 [Sarcophilus harrisii]XP_012395771.1 enkurin domain-containing protein 1 isoform X1 [Sarcophilus harrisii]XP_012395772.1 enkurin domain-containing protein 1 isoform X1 [Sarcophilus harrisii]XP_023350818.1 enkurin domain-containing protein 1 isoform X1 [Sarcophilus harrisii]XP_031806126.1 enkurin domain-containing protein 1 isoform X1 [Sarcophilus harrisii]XP_031806127.1 enkurin domain-containing protein 1 isoform X1 [Sarcophilus harrisii]XP_03
MCEGPSKISGPIPPDPTLFPNYYKRPGTPRSLEGSARKLSLEPPWQPGAPLDQPAPQIHPGSQQSLVGVLLQLQEVSLGSEPLPRRKDLKNHEKENVRRIREIQKRCQEQERGQDHGRPKPLKALWRSPKYDKVESRLKAKLQEPSPASVPELPAFLRAYSRCGPGVQPRRGASAGPALPSTDGSQPPGPDAKGQGPVVDFITHNARTAKVAPRRRSRSLQCLAEVREQQRRAQEEYNTRQKGHVPHYLVERKDLWRREAEERLRNQPDPEIPPGHTMMPESQRLSTLKSLLQKQEELLKELVLLPSGADSLRAQNHKAELEKKLSQVEEALKIFSRPKVFVKMDS